MSGSAIVLRADRWVDIDAGVVRSPAVFVIEGERIAAVNPTQLPKTAQEIELGDLTLLPGLMDMELNMLLGGPHGGNKRSDVQDDPAFRTLRAIVNCRTTLLAGFTTARNLGLFVKTGGYLLDVALTRAIDNGWISVFDRRQVAGTTGVEVTAVVEPLATRQETRAKDPFVSRVTRPDHACSRRTRPRRPARRARGLLRCGAVR